MPKKSAQKKGWSRSNRDWRSLQSQKQTNKKTRLALIVLSIVLILLVVAQAVKFTHTIFSPWKDTSIKRTSLWNGDFNLNIVIKSKDLALLIFNPKQSKVTIINIPPEVYLDASGGFGSWQIGSIYGLGESQKGLGGGKLLKDTTSNLFGLPILGYLNFSDKYADLSAQEIVSEIRKTPFAIFGLFSFLKSDLTPFELVKLNMGLSSVRFDKVKTIDLGAMEVLGEDKLLDGTKVLVADTSKLDYSLAGLQDSILKDEHKTIAIFNSTKHPGLAQKAARLITNIGGEVIITSNGQNELKKTTVLGVKSKTLDYLKQIFGGSSIIDSKQDEDLVSSRADINLFLGEDYFEQL